MGLGIEKIKRGDPMLFRTVLLLIVTLFTCNAEANSVTLLGRSIKTVIPKGYCEVGGSPDDGEIASRMKDAIGNANHIVVLFADCKEVSDYRKDKRKFLDNYGMILTQTPKGKISTLEGITRAQFLQKINDASGRISGSLRAAEAKLQDTAPGSTLTESLGILARDSNGIYLGLRMSLADDSGHTRPVVGVMGATLVKDIPFSINIYKAYKTSPNLGKLLSLQQSAMADFVRANIK